MGKSGWRITVLVAGLAIVFVTFQSCGPFEAFRSSSNSQVTETSGEPDAAGLGDFKCRPPRKYTYTLLPGQERTFLCAPTTSDIFNVLIPDTGHAIARASLVFRNNNSGQIYYWSASVVVGSGEIAYAQGDDVCPDSSTSIKRLLGYGLLESGNGSRVRVQATQGSSPCSDHQISVLSGGSLEVWVEDPDPRCHKRDLNMVSSYQTHGPGKIYWTTSMTKLLSVPVPPSTDRSSLLILGAVEGSPEINPNSSCGNESATLVAQAATNLQGIVDTQILPIPASLGMGHVVISPQAQVSYSPGVTEVSLLIGSNTSSPVFTNDCCGDGKIGFIKLP